MFSGITLYDHTVTIIFRTKTVRTSCDSPRIVSECCICIIFRFDYKSGATLGEGWTLLATLRCSASHRARNDTRHEGTDTQSQAPAKSRCESRRLSGDEAQINPHRWDQPLRSGAQVSLELHVGGQLRCRFVVKLLIALRQRCIL